eukprot:TRINITY_DN9842_c0_g1_i1.p1 TRINITY_DN9842_c0_g1~~TRINITY_DN9842_c0_g1_i1.p1  ORF type:complete len:877 (+),score=225.46 TRINITY_DN9842_c0_g1_i1:385-2631(+)
MDHFSRAEMQPGVFDALVAVRGSAESRRGEFEAELAQSGDRLEQFWERVRGVGRYLSQWLSEPGRHWKYQLIFADKLCGIINCEQALEAQAAEVFLAATVADNYELRRLSVATVSLLLASAKQTVKRQLLTYDREAKALVNSDQVAEPRYLGIMELGTLGSRPDTGFFSFRVDVAQRPTADTYDQQVFIDKNCSGFTGWARIVKAYAPLATTSAMVAIDEAAVPDISLRQVEINKALMPSNELLARLFEHLTIETADDDESGYHNYSDVHADLFKGWFRNYGPVALQRIKPFVDAIVQHLDKRSQQRCLAELLGGLVRGMKHWPYASMAATFEWLLPVLEQAFAHMTNETIPFWVSFSRQCSYDKDPRRIYPLLDWIFDFDLAADTATSIQSCSRLLVASAALAELSWRGSELAERFGNRLLQFTSHPFKLVREQVARTLYIASKGLQHFYVHADGVSHSDGADHIISTLLSQCVTDVKQIAGDNSSHLKTTLCFVIHVFREGAVELVEQHFCRILSLLLELPDSGDDPELQSLTRAALSVCAKLQLESTLVKDVLALFKQAASNGSWHYRIRVLGFVQVFIFRNLFAADGDSVLGLLLEMLQDEHVEVRLTAAVPLAGAIQCGIITMSPELLSRFTDMLPALSKPGRRKRSKIEDDPQTSARKHGAVLGLKALLLAHPYSFPDWMPDLLMALGARINEREPIRATVQQALSEFWRTHQDSWHIDKEKLTEDQVLFLQDLLISPSYYA